MDSGAPRCAKPDDAFFWDAAADDRLVIQRCAECGALRHPPAPMCGTCGSLEWDIADASGCGRIVSWISSLHPNRPDDAPRIVILVELEEGTRLVSNLVDPPHAGPYDDLPVVVEFRDDRGAHAVLHAGAFGERPVTGTIVAGIGATEFSKQSGRSEMQLAAEASRAAILDAGLAPADIDGMVTFTVDGNDEQELMRNLGAGPVTWWSRTPGGGTGACAAMQQAVAAVVSGLADNVLVYRAFNERSGYRYGQPHDGAGPPPLDWYRNFGVDTPAKMYALWFRRYMHAFGATNEDFGRYTVSARRYAATNPKAWFHDRLITLDDHQASRWIVEPVLRLYDCCQESDGGVALVVTRADRAADVDAPVAIRAVADARHADASITANYYYDDLATYPEAAQCAQLLFARSGLTVADIDVAEIYENFSPLVFLVLEAYGFCGPGEAVPFVAEGNLDIDGALPTNTHGGLLGEAYIHGINSIQEGVRQIRGTAVNQVADVEHCLVSSLNSGLVLGRR